MGTPLKNPPVYFTVAQVRFNALLKLAEYLPSVQESMRNAGFPDFGAHKSVAIQLVVQDGQLIPQPVPHERFLFGTVDKTHSFVLTTESLTLQSTNYGRFEAFSEMLMKGLGLVHEIVRLDFTERVGLRYLDHVFPANSDKLELYLAPEVLGVSARVGGVAVHSLAETLSVFDRVNLRSRVVIQDGPVSFPPDLLPAEMVVNQRFVDVVGRHALVDTDGFITDRAVYSSVEVAKQLDEIHTVISSAFKATVSAYAYQVWDR